MVRQQMPITARYPDGRAHYHSSLPSDALIPTSWCSEDKKQWALPGGELFTIAAIIASRIQTLDGALAVL